MAAAGLAAAATAGILYVRYVRLNRFEVVAGQVYRSAQPTPDALKRWTKRYGLRTVVNLRGKSDSDFYQPQRAAAQAAGVRMIDVRFTASRQPTTPWLRRFIDALKTAERPILLHCRDGIDRAGVASVLAAMAVGGQDYQTARRHAWLSFQGRNDQERHITDLLLAYEEYCHREQKPTVGWAQFKDWALNHYHPYYYRVQIDAPATLTARPGQTLPVTVTITNRSGRTIPTGSADKQFMLGAFWQRRDDDWPRRERQIGPQYPLPKRDIPPAGSVQVTHHIPAPSRSGRHILHFDVAETHVTWFGREGSPVAQCELLVRPAGSNAD